MTIEKFAPYLLDRDDEVWTLSGGEYTLRSLGPWSPEVIEAKYGPLTPLWTALPSWPVANEVINNTVLPDLRAWHEVPIGATIPKGVTYVSMWEDGSLVSGRSGLTQQLPNSPRRFTEQPITIDTSAWHPVPVGATIPKGARFAFGSGRRIIESASEDIHQIAGDVDRFTPEPIPDPDDDLIDAILDCDSPGPAKTLINTIRNEKRKP